MAVEDILFGSWLEFKDDVGCRLVEIGVPEPSDGVTIGVKNDFLFLVMIVKSLLKVPMYPLSQSCRRDTRLMEARGYT